MYSLLHRRYSTLLKLKLRRW